MAAHETPPAQARSLPSVSGVANRQSSTTLSIDSSPQANAFEITRQVLQGVRAAAIQRRAFQWEIP